MKNIKIIIALILLIASANKLKAQDDARLGINIGYFQDIKGFNFLDSEIKYSVIQLGVEHQIRIARSTNFTYGLNFDITDMHLPASTGGSFVNPAAPSTDKKFVVAQLYAGFKQNLFTDGIFWNTGILLEYDLIEYDDHRNGAMNGVGFYGGLGCDIKLGRDYILTINPQVRTRAMLLFKKNELNWSNDIFPSSFYVDYGLNMTVAYKFF